MEASGLFAGTIAARCEAIMKFISSAICTVAFASCLVTSTVARAQAASSPQPGAGAQASTAAAPAIGLPLGQKAPDFSARDQFGHEQTNASVKGSKGTVLVFFRSADW